MKTVVFSDTHLSDLFDAKKCEFLKHLINNADRVIINGDFWDGHIITFDTFVKSPWSQLFPLLKSKKTVYVHGNHDRKEFCDSRVNLFSVEQHSSYRLNDSSSLFSFEHGNHTLPSIDERLPLPESFFSAGTKAYTFIEGIITRRIRKSTRFWGKLLNNRLKKSKNNGNFRVFGHTHFAEFDPVHKFAVTGFIQHGLAQYLLIENGAIRPVEEHYS